MDAGEILKNTGELPTLPTIYSQMLEAMSDSRSTAKDVAAIIEKDQASTLKILKTVNSPVFGSVQKIDTIHKAIFFLGFKEVKNLVFSLSMFNMFKGYKSTPYFNLVEYWKHSIAVGVIARKLGEISGVKEVDNYFAAGIIHDIGKLILLFHGKTDYSKVIDFAIENNITVGRAENEVLGFSHSRLGSFAAEKWGMPDSLKNAIKYHSRGLTDNGFDNLTACVHAADILSRAMKLGNPGDELIPKPNAEIWKHIKIAPGAITATLPELMTAYTDSISILITK